QAGDGNGTDSRGRHLGPGSRFSVRTYGRVAHHIARGAENGLAVDDRLTTVRTVIHLERWRTGERLRRGVDPGHLLITTGLKRRWIVVTVRLHPMAQLTQHLHHDRALFLTFGDGFLAAIGRSRDQAGVCFKL